MKKKTTIEIDDFRKSESLFQGPDSLAPYPLHVGSPPIAPVDKRLLSANAVETMHKNAAQQMHMLRSQAALIMKQVKDIEDRLHISERIYKSQMAFEPIVGGTYHLYSKNEGEVLSMVAPYEWGSAMPFDAWVASVRLLGDKTWEVLAQSSV